MRVFIVGAGEVGFNTAQMLSREGHEVTIVEQSEDLVNRVGDQLDAMVMLGNGASPKMLSEIGAHKSELLIAVTDSDEVNITACLVAKAQGVNRTVARIRNPDYYDTKEPFARDVLGIDFVIHTERAAAEEIRDALRVPGSVNVETFAEDNIEVAEVALKKDSPIAGKVVKDIELPEGSLLVGVVRENETIIPQGDTEIRVGDHVFLISERKNINRVVRAVSTDTEKVEDVMIFGGGRIGLRLAMILEREGVSVKIVEKDEERAQYVASRLRKALVLHDEGMSRDFLLQERVDRTGAFIAATGDDRANLLAVMYAKQLGTKRTISVVSRAEFAPLSEALGVDIAISPRLITAGAILRFVRKGEVVAVNVLESGAEMIELRVPDRCPVAGRPLSEVGFPDGAIVGAIMRDGDVVIPTGAEVLKKGDDAVVFTVESAVDEVERLFAP
ncbi:MAG: Trk system potassium transporter TrkA [Rubrobacteraceae bacterium]